MRYVESAVLRVVDESSAQLAKIEANLKKFGATASATARQLDKIGKGGFGNAGGPAGMKARAAGLANEATKLRANATAASSAASSIGKLAGAYGKSDAKSAAFLASTKQITSALSAQARAAASAKASIAALPGGKMQTPGSASNANALLTAQTNRASAQAQLAQLRLQQAQNRAATAPGKRRFGGKIGALGGGLTFGGEGLMKTLTEIGVGSMVVKAGHVTLEGAIAGSNAREAFRQSGNANAAMLPGLTADLARRYGSSAAAVINEAAEVTPYSPDPRVQAKLVELLERQKTLAGARGGDTKAVEAGALKVFKGLDLAGTLTPDERSGEVDLGKVETMFRAYQAIQSMEGKNFGPGDFRNLMKYSGLHAQTYSAEGAMRAMLYGADVSGSTAGMQVRSTDKLMSGALGGTIGKKALATWISEGFAEKDASGRVHAMNESAYAKDPISELARLGIEGMHKKGLSEFNKEDISKYVGALHQNSYVSTFLAQSIARNSEALREIKQAGLVNNSAKDAETAGYRSTSDALTRLKNSFENVGSSLDASGLGKLARILINAGANSVNDFANNPTAIGAGKMAAMVGVPAFAGLKTFNALFNPLTASATSLTTAGVELQAAAAALGRSAIANGAQNALGAGAKAAGAVGAAEAIPALGVKATLGAAALPVAAGIVGATVANGFLYGAMKGLVAVGAVQPTKDNAQAGYQRANGAAAYAAAHPAEVAAERAQWAARQAHARAVTVAATNTRQVAAAIGQSAKTILASEQYLSASQSRIASGAGTGGWSAQFATPAEKAARQREQDWADDAAGDAEDEKKRISKLTKKQRQEIAAGQARMAQIDRAGITPIGNTPGGSFGLGGGNVPEGQAPVGTPGAALPTIARGGEVGGIVETFKAATSQFTSALDGAGAQLEAAGNAAAAAMREGITSGGAAAAAKISAAVSDIHVSVSTPSASPTGPSTQSKG